MVRSFDMSILSNANGPVLLMLIYYIPYSWKCLAGILFGANYIWQKAVLLNIG